MTDANNADHNYIRMQDKFGSVSSIEQPPRPRSQSSNSSGTLSDLSDAEQKEFLRKCFGILAIANLVTSILFGVVFLSDGVYRFLYREIHLHPAQSLAAHVGIRTVLCQIGSAYCVVLQPKWLQKFTLSALFAIWVGFSTSVPLILLGVWNQVYGGSLWGLIPMMMSGIAVVSCIFFSIPNSHGNLTFAKGLLLVISGVVTTVMLFSVLFASQDLVLWYLGPQRKILFLVMVSLTSVVLGLYQMFFMQEMMTRNYGLLKMTFRKEQYATAGLLLYLLIAWFLLVIFFIFFVHILVARKLWNMYEYETKPKSKPSSAGNNNAV